MIGNTISHYKILEELGSGGMGVVYKAEDVKLKRPVALKFLAPELTRDPEIKERFIHEAQAASALEHNNICTIHEIDETKDGQMFISMAYCEGETLKQKIKCGPLSLEEATSIAIQIAQGLAKAHEQGIIHRDIKPGNIIITNDGIVKIVDFGLAKLAGQTMLTRTGTIMGTVAYMSPEQARGEGVDYQTDIWSLGVVLYEMLSGKPPFKGDHEQAVMYSILNEKPEPVAALKSGIPAELERIVEKTITRNPDERYKQMSDILVDLRSLEKKIESKDLKQASAKKALVKRKWIFVFGGIIAILALLFISRFFFFQESIAAIESIAVLPLENLSGDPSQDYFSDGMTEVLIADLAKIGSLKVISRTSVMRYKHSEKSLPEIARELKVDAIVEGSVLLTGDRVRINAQLIEAATDRHLWAEQYERDLKDVLALQNEVARVIANEVKINLTPLEQTQLESAPVVNPEAQKAYLKGLYYWNKRTEEALKKSIEYFELAIEKDPGYALAYVGLANTYQVMSSWGTLKPKDAFPRAIALAEKALEIDDKLAEAHVSLASSKFAYEFDWSGAESSFKRAIELKPNYAIAHQWYAEHLLWNQRYEEAVKEINRALDLDPLSLIINSSQGYILYCTGQLDKALEQFRAVLEMDPDFFPAHYFLQFIYLSEGMYDHAVKELEEVYLHVGVSPEDIMEMRKSYKTSGIDGVYRWQLKVLKELSKQRYINPYNFAVNYAALGKVEKAFEWLEIEEQSFEGMHLFSVDKRFNDFCKDPRFKALLKKFGLEKR